MRDQTKVVTERAILEAEVGRIEAAAAAAGATVRVLGSIGVAMHCPDAAVLLPAFDRTYADIDLAGYRSQTKALFAALAGLGYREDRDVYITSEGARSIYEDPARHLHLDVFYDRLEFCHVIPLDGRLEADAQTIPLAELLLSKLQIVKINTKDLVDAVLLLLDHPLGSDDAGVIDADRIAALCADDWGLWRTTTINLDKVSTSAAGYPQLHADQRVRVQVAVDALKARLDREPKTLGWRMRARIGERRQWWTDVDEVD
ncbi:MAG TPA: hypothetical protein VIF84_07060 [Candidatus Limnocylindrales bacterium]|jgi:hypothetical protein